MFLFENERYSVLYTGDLRADKSWLTQIARDPILSPYLYRIKILDVIYLDTSFCSVTDHLYFPSKVRNNNWYNHSSNAEKGFWYQKTT